MDGSTDTATSRACHPCGLAAFELYTAHNHPSDDASPLRQDVRLTQRLHEVDALVGIELATASYWARMACTPARESKGDSGCRCTGRAVSGPSRLSVLARARQFNCAVAPPEVWCHSRIARERCDEIRRAS